MKISTSLCQFESEAIRRLIQFEVAINSERKFILLILKNASLEKSLQINLRIEDSIEKRVLCMPFKLVAGTCQGCLGVLVSAPVIFHSTKLIQKILRAQKESLRQPSD